MTHSLPTRRSSDLSCAQARPGSGAHYSSCRSPAPAPPTDCSLAAISAIDEGEPERRSNRHPEMEAWLTRSEEHTSELQSLMRISYAVFCLKKKNRETQTRNQQYVISQKDEA